MALPSNEPWARGRRRVLAGVAGLAFALGGCASFSPDAGFATAQGIAGSELGKDVVKVTNEAEAAAIQARVAELLRSPLTPDAAVQIALLKNRGLQAAFNDLGVAEAVYVKASLPPNPTFSVLWLAGGFDLEIERQILIGLFELATLPARTTIAATRFRAAQLRTAEAVLRLAAESRRQYYRTVAADQQVAFLQQALSTAEAASELARRLGESGALNKLEQAREHAFYVELGAQLARARITREAERERLIRLLGLWGRDLDFRLPRRLPPLPARLAGAREIERRALERRVDLQVARLDLEAQARQYGLTDATRFVSDIELAGASKYERSKSLAVDEHGNISIDREKVRTRGVEIAFEIPIYDFGASSMRNAEEAYMAAANRLAERAVNVRSEAREAYLRTRGSYDLARYYQSRVLPLRQTIQDEALLHYSGMLIDVNQLIVDARARILSNIDAINARRDFFIAATDLTAALIGGGTGGGADIGTTVAAAGADAGGGH